MVGYSWLTSGSQYSAHHIVGGQKIAMIITLLLEGTFKFQLILADENIKIAHIYGVPCEVSIHVHTV